MNGFCLREPNGQAWLLEPIPFDLPCLGHVHVHRDHRDLHDHHGHPKCATEE